MTMAQKHPLFDDYIGISRYAGVPTEQTTGRLHYNENLYGPSPKCLDTLRETSMEDLYLYESNARDDLIEAIAQQTGIPAENLFVNNGSAENIKSILSIFAKRGDTVLLPDPGWSYYTGLANYKFLNVVRYPILEGEKKCAHDVEAILRLARLHRPRLLFITTPAMPTGNKIADEELERILRELPDTLVLVDEAYLGFTPYTLDVRRIIETYDNVIFSRTFSKYYGLANLRIGYGFCSRQLKDVLFLDLPLHRLPHIGKRMAIAALRDQSYYDRITAELIETREEFSSRLNALPGIRAYASDANFVYIRLVGYDVERIKAIVEENGYLIRIFTGNEEKHLRITIGTKALMERFTPLLIQTIRDSAI